jgi:hypothetical protein
MRALSEISLHNRVSGSRVFDKKGRNSSRGPDHQIDINLP